MASILWQDVDQVEMKLEDVEYVEPMRREKLVKWGGNVKTRL